MVVTIVDLMNRSAGSGTGTGDQRSPDFLTTWVDQSNRIGRDGPVGLEVCQHIGENGFRLRQISRLELVAA